MITLRGLTKRYGATTAVDHLDLDIPPGRVTGFLGPNGAGKSTTMRMIIGLDRPTSGEALVGGRHYRSFTRPLVEVGALLEAKATHPGRTGRNHLLAMARSNAIPARRVDEVIATVGLSEAAGRRAGTYSLGMGQRLGIAGALLGDPPILIFDEPVNGLDPDGVRWIRELMRSMAADGRTVLVSSHLMSEMQLTADHLVVIGRGRLIADAPMGDIIAGGQAGPVTVRTPDPAGLAALRARLAEASVVVQPVGDDGLVVTGATVGYVGDLAHQLGVRLHELSAQAASLEDVYLNLTADSLEFSGTGQPAGTAGLSGTASLSGAGR